MHRNYTVSSLTLLQEATFHTPVILDSGAGPCVDYHGDNVLIPSTRSKRQDVLTCWPCAFWKTPSVLFQTHTYIYLANTFFAYRHWLRATGAHCLWTKGTWGTSYHPRINMWLTIVNESSDPLPEVQASDSRSNHVTTSIDELIDQVGVLIHHSNVERSNTWDRAKTDSVPQSTAIIWPFHLLCKWHIKSIKSLTW